MPEKKCEKCKQKNAKVKFTEVIEGKKVIKHLCKECAESAAMGIDEHPIAIPKPKTESRFLTDVENLVCSNCGLSLYEFFKKTKFGCADCYDAFSKILPSFLEKLHGSSVHRGKRYTPNQKPNLIFRRRVIQRALDEAVKNEEFERAAHLRDLLKTLNDGGEQNEDI